MPLTELIARYPRLVLVGEAGAGKTTCLKYIALVAANAYTGLGSRREDWLQGTPPLPLFLPLHGFGIYLADQTRANRESPSPDLLRDYIVHHLRHLELPEGWVTGRLKAGNLLILLDGLDEVARFKDRRFVADLITRFASFYDRCQIVVTTRPQGYEGAAQLGGSFERRDINPLRWPEDVRTFLYRWNETINQRAEGGTLSAKGRQRAHDSAHNLIARLKLATNIRELANNPLLLTVMAIVHYNIGTLPERRADLYDAATGLLLGWDKRMGREALAPPGWLDTLTAAQRRLPLEESAFDFQEQHTLEKSRTYTLSYLYGYFLAGQGPEAEETARVRAEEYLTWVTGRTYVLQDISGVIRFYRKPFQEYLAARRVARLPDLHHRVQEILATDWRDRWWDETLLLTAGQLVTDNPQKASDLLTFIQSLPDASEVPNHNTTFVARALADVPEGLTGSVWEIRKTVTEHLTSAITAVDPTFKPSARLEAGIALSALGDPRLGVGVSKEEKIPDLLWVEVPSGPFLMGFTDEAVAYWKDWPRQQVQEGIYEIDGLTPQEVLELLWNWLDGERGRHQLELPAFLIGRYPVTNAQYACFVNTEGYENPRWWGGEDSPGWAWRKGKPRLEWQRTDRPDFWHDPRFNHPSQPVVGVTWYEAMAFCRWLETRLQALTLKWRVQRGDKLGTLDQENETRTVRLPTEAEWEKAARGSDGRTWPWGDGWDDTRANTADINLNQTLPVGILPSGDSPYGVADMAGGVWEWTVSLWGPDWRVPTFVYPYRQEDGREDTSPGDDISRVVRGGSWADYQNLACCACRGAYYPYVSYPYLGFRCISIRVAPDSRAGEEHHHPPQESA